MGDDAESSSTLAMEPRTRLFNQAHVPPCIDIMYPGFTVDDREYPGTVREYPPRTICVVATPTKGTKLHIEFTADNIHMTAHACPPPPPPPQTVLHARTPKPTPCERSSYQLHVVTSAS